MTGGLSNTSDLLRASAHAYPRRPAIMDGSRTYTYEQFDELVDRFSAWFLTRQFDHGFRAAYLFGNQWEVLLTYHAVGRAGGLIVPLNSRLTPSEMAFLVDEAKVNVVIYDKEFEGILGEVLSLAQQFVVSVVSGGSRGLAQHVLSEILDSTSRPEMSAFPQISADDDSGIWFTSGTTGKSKGAVCTHRSSVFSAILTATAAHVSSRTRLLSVAPMFHRGAMEDVHLAVTLMGGTHILEKRFDPQRTLKLLQDTQTNFAFIVPTMAQMMLDVQGHEDFDLSNLACWMSASAPLRDNVQDRIRTELRLPQYALQNTYGITESLLNTYCDGIDLRSRPQSVGRIVPLTEVRIWSKSTGFMAPGEVGEIVISGPCQLRTYLGRDQDYENAILNIDKKRWYRSGDLGYLDNEGFLSIVDRSKDMIISGGENVYSAEVEMAIVEHKSVAEVAVVSEPDDKWGERVVAVVVLKRAASASESDLLQACERIASYKRPKKFVFVDELPRNSFGKVQKALLREMLAKQS